MALAGVINKAINLYIKHLTRPQNCLILVTTITGASAESRPRHHSYLLLAPKEYKTQSFQETLEIYFGVLPEIINKIRHAPPNNSY